uniref:Calcium-transporting ATPase 1 n=1 Tax=Lygus hesperus TaxID=30085 RepID=A0A0A9WS54_LYGHE
MMKTRSSTISSTGEALLEKKTSTTRGVSIRECQEEQCEGIQALRSLQGYVTVTEKLQTGDAGPGPEKVPADLKVPEVTELESSKTDVTGGKREPRRKPKDKPTNPFWTDGNRQDHPLLPIPRPPRTVEIRGGDILGQCECLKRNGLQHDCPKWDCRGEDLCLTWPIPTCQPSGLGVPIIVESRVKKPDPANCDLTADEQKKAEKVAAMEKRKEEVRLIEHARSDWKIGKEQAALLKTANRKKGYLKCNIHSGKYRLVPLMRDEITQTPDELCTCPCDEMEHQQTAQVSMNQPAQSPCNQKETSEAQAKATKEPPTHESVRTSTTGIPTTKQLKAQIKTLKTN